MNARRPQCAATLILQQREQKRHPGDGGPNAGEQYPIENGRMDGDRVRLKLTTANGGSLTI